MNQEIEKLTRLSGNLAGVPLSSYRDVLAQRRAALDVLAADQRAPYAAVELATAFASGREARSRLLVELGSLRDKIEDLRRLRAGLGQLRPNRPAAPSLDVRL